MKKVILVIIVFCFFEFLPLSAVARIGASCGATSECDAYEYCDVTRTLTCQNATSNIPDSAFEPPTCSYFTPCSSGFTCRDGVCVNDSASAGNTNSNPNNSGGVSAPGGASSGDKSYGLTPAATGAGYSTKADNTVIPTLTGILQIALGLTGVVFFAMALYSGVRWLTARGNEELVTKAREALQNAIIGLVVVSASYAISTFVVDKIFSGSQNTTSSGSGSGTGCCTGIATGPGANAMSYCRTIYFGHDVLPKIKSDCDRYNGVWQSYEDPNNTGDSSDAETIGQCTILSGMGEEGCAKSGGTFVQQDCNAIPSCRGNQ